METNRQNEIIKKNKNTSSNYRIAKCLTCGREFSYYLGHTAGKFCSKECYNKFVAIPKKECVICGKLYKPDKGNKERWDKSKYCSLECANKGKIKGKLINCNYCGAPIWIAPYDERIKKHHFCSKRCFNLFKKGKHIKKNYLKGYRAEYKAKKELEKKGYIVVRNFLSWGVWDLCAIGIDHIRFIQVKSTCSEKTSFSPAIKKLIGYAEPPFATKELWVHVDYKGWKKFQIVGDTYEKLDENNLPCSKLRKESIIIVSESPFGLGQRRVNDFITVIDPFSRKIYLIQAKAKKLSQNARNRLKTQDYSTSQLLNGKFKAEFHIITNLEELKQVLKLKGGG